MNTEAEVALWATHMRELFGQRAEVECALRADDATLSGDGEGAAFWQQVRQLLAEPSSQ
jgi:hypothetical protein